MITDRRYTLPIEEIIEETVTVRTFVFRIPLDPAPGQFVMLTDFEGGEKPFSIADYREGRLFLTIKRIGDFTQRLFHRKAGDLISIRGAYGSSFFVPEPGTKQARACLLVGGGYGLPPLYFLARRLREEGLSVTVINAARREEDLLYRENFAKLGVRFVTATEGCPDPDDFRRFRGTAADCMERILGEEEFCKVYASGPDLMMKSLVPLLGDRDYQFLFERYMKCAIGICGSCVMDPSGIRVCREGPALSREQVEQLEDFGVYKRSASGARTAFADRFSGGEAS